MSSGPSARRSSRRCRRAAPSSNDVVAEPLEQLRGLRVLGRGAGHDRQDAGVAGTVDERLLDPRDALLTIDPRSELGQRRAVAAVGELSDQDERSGAARAEALRREIVGLAGRGLGASLPWSGNASRSPVTGAASASSTACPRSLRSRAGAGSACSSGWPVGAPPGAPAPDAGNPEPVRPAAARSRAAPAAG